MIKKYIFVPLGVETCQWRDCIMHSFLTAALPYGPDHLQTHELHVASHQRGVHNAEKMIQEATNCDFAQVSEDADWVCSMHPFSSMRSCRAPVDTTVIHRFAGKFCPPSSFPPKPLPRFLQNYKVCCLSEDLFSLPC